MEKFELSPKDERNEILKVNRCLEKDLECIVVTKYPDKAVAHLSNTFQKTVSFTQETEYSEEYQQQIPIENTYLFRFIGYSHQSKRKDKENIIPSLAKSLRENSMITIQTYNPEEVIKQLKEKENLDCYFIHSSLPEPESETGTMLVEGVYEIVLKGVEIDNQRDY